MSSILELRAAVWFIQGERMHLLYPTLNHEPLPIHQYRRMERQEPRMYLREWFPLDWHNEYFVRRNMLDLYEAVTRRFDNLDLLTSEWLLEWVEEAFERELVTVYEKLPWRPMGDDESHEAYAANIGITAPIHHAPILLHTKTPSPNSTVPEYRGTEDPKGWKDETDNSCPSRNWRSESYSTATPRVKAWMDLHDSRDIDGKNSTLGYVGGGGFYVSTTRVVEVVAGTRVYRFCGPSLDAETGLPDPGSPMGGWWGLGAYPGDPRAYFALPTFSSGVNLVCGKTTFTCTALEGLGAPRCSNKPGGPKQLFFSFKDRKDKLIRLI